MEVLWWSGDVVVRGEEQKPKALSPRDNRARIFRLEGGIHL